MRIKLKTPYALALSQWEIAQAGEGRGGTLWTGWQRRHWPSNTIRPGTLVYGYNGNERRLAYLLRITRGGGFTYATKKEFRRHVKKLIGHDPNTAHPHWKVIPTGTRTKMMTGFAVRWKVLELADIPHHAPFRQLGWELMGDRHSLVSIALDSADLYEEGGRVLRSHLAVERNPTLRKDAKIYWRQQMRGRIRCLVCGFEFGRRYGARGEDFIEMHHEKPVATMNRKVRRKRTSLVPVCANCHRMIHRDPMNLLSISNLKAMLM